MTPALVTLTRFPDLFARLAASVEQHEPAIRKIVVIDADGSLPDCPGWEVVQGIRPFVFARNANLGLVAAGAETDVLLINDDCELVMPVSPICQELLLVRPDLGVLSPLIDGDVGNPLQRRPGRSPGLVYSRERLAFVCVWLPATTRQKVGGLDEEFVDYGGEDWDFCDRVREAGLTLGITGQVWVRHGHVGAPQRHSASYLRLMTEPERLQHMIRMNRLVFDKRQQRRRQRHESASR